MGNPDKSVLPNLITADEYRRAVTEHRDRIEKAHEPLFRETLIKQFFGPRAKEL